MNEPAGDASFPAEVTLGAPDGLRMAVMKIRLTSPGIIGLKYVWIGIFVAGAYWVLESLIHVVIFQQGSFFSQLWTVDNHELWKRCLFVGMLLSFSLYVQHGVNARRRTEEALKTSEKKYRTLITEALNPIFVFDDGGHFVDHNNAALQFFECGEDEFHLRTYHELTSLSSQPESPTNKPLQPQLGQIEVEHTINGTTKTLLLNVAPVKIDETSKCYFGIGQDITERKDFERTLELAHAELNQIFQTASSAMRLVDLNSNVLKINQTFADLAGVSEDSAVGLKCFEVFSGDQCHTPQCPLTRILDGEQEIEYKLTKTRADGADVSCLLTARPYMGPEGQLVGMVESFKDITELVHVQEEFRAERDRFRHLLFQQFEGVGIVRQDHTIEYQNNALTKEIGSQDGRACFEAFRSRNDPCPSCYLLKAIDSGESQTCEFESPSGRIYQHIYTPFRDASGEEKGLVMLRDVTESKASRAAVIRSEQLAALGELAAGVAHEINNPINGILNYGQMLINKHLGGESVAEIGKRIVTEGDRVATIVESLLAFARRDSHRRVQVSILEIINDSLTLVGAQLRKDSIKINIDLPENLPLVTCVPQGIQQVILNLLDNARYSLNQKFPSCNDNKTITISAHLETIANTQHVVVSIQDCGDGIPADIVNRVMNPFFSTKPKGSGTGLGLSISHAIVTEHGGHLNMESAEGEFTRVDISLPETVN